jgi:hypothetical protein
VTTRHCRIALLTGASLPAIAGAGEPCNMAAEFVWYDAAGEIFRGSRANDYCDGLAADIAAAGEPF